MKRNHKGIIMLYGCSLLILIILAFPVIYPQSQYNLTSSDKAYLKTLNGIVAVGDDAYPPFGFVENGQSQGYEKDLIEALKGVLGIDITYKPMLWTKAQEALLNGEAHMITGMRITDERGEKYDFTDPYLLTSFSIISPDEIGDIEELNGKYVVVQEGSNTAKVLENAYAEIISVPTPLDAMEYLNAGLADAWVENHQVATYYLNKSQNVTFSIHNHNESNYQVTTLKDTAGDYAIAVNKEYNRLTGILNKALMQLQREDRLDILDLKWFGLTMSRDTGNDKYLLGFYALVFVFLTSGCLLLSYNELLRIRVGEKTKELEEQNTKLTNFSLNTAQALGTAIEFKDIYTGGHSQRVAEISNVIGEKIGLSKEELFQLYLGALIHDVGKVGIPDEILKKPGRLTPEEYDMIKEHPEIGKKILSYLEGYDYIRQIAFYHHERYDGNKEGTFAAYPGLLKGEEIPLAARIVSLADSYDAMTSDRPYRKGLDKEEAKRRILADSGKQSYLVRTFMKILDEIEDI